MLPVLVMALTSRDIVMRRLNRLLWLCGCGWLACIGCRVPTPVGAVNTAAAWDVQCGRLKARVVEATQQEVRFEQTLVGDAAAPRAKRLTADDPCELNVTKAKLIARPRSSSDDGSVVTSATLAPMVVEPGERTSQTVTIDF